MSLKEPQASSKPNSRTNSRNSQLSQPYEASEHYHNPLSKDPSAGGCNGHLGDESGMQRSACIATLLCFPGWTENHHAGVLLAELFGNACHPQRNCFASDLWSGKGRNVHLKKCRTGANGIGGIFLASIVFGHHVQTQHLGKIPNPHKMEVTI